MSFRLCRTVLFEILSLFEDGAEDFVACGRRVFVLGEGEDYLHFQLRLDVCFLVPVDVLCLVVDNVLDIFCKGDVLLFGIFV